MKKRLILLLTALSMLLSSNAFAEVYIEDMNEYLFDLGAEAFDTRSQNKEISVKPEKDFVLELDILGQVRINISTDRQNYELFQGLIGGRGACIRENKAAVWFYDEGGKKMDISSGTHNYKFYMNLSTSTIDTYIDGVKASYSSVENVYTPQNTVALAGTTVKSFTFSGGTVSKIKAYYPPASVNTEIADEEYMIKYNALNFLGIIPDSLATTGVSDTLTRAQFAALAARLIGIREYNGEGAFPDVKKSNFAYAYINGLKERNYMNGYGEKFKPNQTITAEEAVCVIGRMLGYNEILFDSKETMYFYSTNKFFYEDILKGVNIKSSRQELCAKEVISLIYNALTARRYKFDYKELNLSDDPEDTLLYSYYGYVCHEEALIDSVEYGSKNINVTLKDGKNEKWLVSNEVSILNIVGTKQYIWVNQDDETVYYMYPYNYSRTLWGYISEYNKELSSGSVKPSKIAKIALLGMEGYINTDSDLKVYKNGGEVTESIEPVGLFVRLDIENNEVYAINILNAPVEGGIVKYISNDRITYIEGNVLEILDTNLTQNVISILDGSEVSYNELSVGMYFDYITDGNATYLLFSSAKCEGKINSVSDEKIKIGDEYANVTVNTVYTSTDGGESWSASGSVSDFIGLSVIAYLDMSGNVRYLATAASIEKYGIVFGGGDDDSDGEFMTVGIVTDTGIEKKVYEYDGSKKTVYAPEVTYYEALETKKKLNGDCVYKFTIKGDKIKKIEQISWDGEMRTDGKNVEYSNSRIVPKDTKNNYTYVNPSATIIMLLNGDGEFDPQITTLYKLNGMKTEGYDGFSFRVDDTKPMAELMVLGENFSNMYNSTWYYGVISQIDEIYEDEEIYKEYTIASPGGINKYKVKADNPLTVAGTEVKNNDVILYAYNGISSEIQKPLNTRILSIEDENMEKYSHGTTIQSGTSSETGTRDFYIGGRYVKEQSGFIHLNSSGEDKWIKKSGLFKAYILHGKKLTDTSVSDLVGKTVYVAANEGMAQMLIGVER